MGVATSAEFTVPEGYVAILREFKYVVDPVLNLPCTDVLISILVDDIPQPNYDQMPLGSEQENFIPCYILADNGQRIALRYDNSAAAPAFSVDVCVTFHGNLLLRTGVPIEYEPGNPAAAEPIIRGTTLAAGGGVSREPRAMEPGQAASRIGRRTGRMFRTTRRIAPVRGEVGQTAQRPTRVVQRTRVGRAPARVVGRRYRRY